MSVPLLVGLAMLALLVAAAAGVWRARQTGAAGVQMAIALLIAVIAAGVLTWLVLRSP